MIWCKIFNYRHEWATSHLVATLTITKCQLQIVIVVFACLMVSLYQGWQSASHVQTIADHDGDHCWASTSLQAPRTEPTRCLLIDWRGTSWDWTQSAVREGHRSIYRSWTVTGSGHLQFELFMAASSPTSLFAPLIWHSSIVGLGLVNCNIAFSLQDVECISPCSIRNRGHIMTKHIRAWFWGQLGVVSFSQLDDPNDMVECISCCWTSRGHIIHRDIDIECISA